MADLPEMMTAIEISSPGGPEVLKPCQRPMPTPAPGEVLLKVAYAGVNRPDVVQRKGLYPPPPGASDLPGLEVSGTVVAVGEGVDAGEIGSRLCALVSGGGYAEYCVAPFDQCLPVPAALSMAEAAALPETLFTVWHNVFERAYACDGEAILIHGGTSGIGTMSIKLCKLFGLTVIVTCGSDDKCAAAVALGADHAINYSSADFVEEVKKITSAAGVHIVLDMVAGSYVPRNLQCLREDGRHVTIAVQGGMVAEINMAQVMMRRLMLTGSTLRARSAEFKALLAQEIYSTVWPMVADGALRPEMDKSFPLAEAAAAHAHMESGEHVGKIVLEV
jgi:NADPH:quinone reductase